MIYFVDADYSGVKDDEIDYIIFGSDPAKNWKNTLYEIPQVLLRNASGIKFRNKKWIKFNNIEMTTDGQNIIKDRNTALRALFNLIFDFL